MAKAWEKQRQESDAAYTAFRKYLDSPIPRPAISTVAVGASVWSSKWTWLERTEAYDNHVAAVEQREQDKIIAQNASKWAMRKEAAAERTHDLSMRIWSRVEEMLMFPLSTKTTADNGITVHVHPAKWNLATACQLAKAAVELANVAIAAGCDDEDDFDPLTASEDELRVWLEKQQAKQKSKKQLGSELRQITDDRGLS